MTGPPPVTISSSGAGIEVAKTSIAPVKLTRAELRATGVVVASTLKPG